MSGPSKTIVETKLPPPTAAELRMQEITEAMMPQLMEQAGFILEETGKKDWKEYPEYAQLQKLQSEKADMAARGGAGVFGDFLLSDYDDRPDQLTSTLKKRAQKEGGAVLLLERNSLHLS